MEFSSGKEAVFFHQTGDLLLLDEGSIETMVE